MDRYIDIILSEQELDSCEIHEATMEWGGEILHKSPREFEFCGVKMHEYVGHGYITDIDDAIVLNVSTDLNCIEADCNIGKNDPEDNEIFKLLSRVVKLDRFGIALGFDDEIISDSIEYEKGMNLKEIMVKFFDWDNSNGVIIYGKNSCRKN